MSSSLPGKLEGLRGTLNGNVEELKLLDILISIAREFAAGDAWHALEVSQVFEPLTEDQAKGLVTPGFSRIIVKGNPPAQAPYAAYPISRNSVSGNGQPHQ